MANNYRPTFFLLFGFLFYLNHVFKRTLFLKNEKVVDHHEEDFAMGISFLRMRSMKSFQRILPLNVTAAVLKVANDSYGKRKRSLRLYMQNKLRQAKQGNHCSKLSIIMKLKEKLIYSTIFGILSSNCILTCAQNQKI